jgi:hypothetical protein
MSPFIHHCQCLRGFFTLRPCDAETAAACTRCQRHVCRRHLGGLGVCVDCAARADEDRLFDEEGDAWFYRSRHRFYTTHHYRAVSWGTVGTGYDDYDLRSFDQRAIDDDTVTVPAGGLEDS